MLHRHPEQQEFRYPEFQQRGNARIEMSKYKKKNSGKGSDKQMLAALQSPVGEQDAELPVTHGAVTHDMNITTAGPDEPKFELQSDEQPIANERLALPEASAESPPNVMHGTLGQRLRAAREIRGWKAGDVAGRLRLPIQIIQAIEAEQYDKIGHGIYLRGYLKSYARLVDVPTVLVDNVTSERSHEPALVTSGTISHSRYLYQRYSVSALYLILTGVIIVPAVLLAMRASMQPAVTQLTPLDAPASSIATDNAPGATAEPVTTTTAGPTSTALEAAPAADSAPAAPLVASLAPFSALSHTDNSNHVETRAPVTGAHSLKLTLNEASWVEVTSAGGDKLEFGLLPAGSSRTYSSDKALDVRLGNCSGAEVEADGKIQDLTAYRRANVAHFKLFAAGGELISN
jgi:cytoskeleton protein RodZ